MRIGFNSNKDKEISKSNFFHQVIIPVYIPNENDYFKDSFQISKYNSDLNLFGFIKENSLWNSFLIKEMIKKFVIFNFDIEYSKEIYRNINKNIINADFNRFILKTILILFINFRKNIVRVLNKV